MLESTALLKSFNSRTLGRVRPPWNRRSNHSREFQFTHPGKGATVDLFVGYAVSRVSIHAPWEGCDSLLHLDTHRMAFVSIHAPWEGCDELVVVLGLGDA